MSAIIRIQFIAIWIFFALVIPASLIAQDTIYSHWPTVRPKAFDPALRDALVAELEKLLTRPVMPDGKSNPPAAGKPSPAWQQLETARQLTDARDFIAAARVAEDGLETAKD